MASRHNSRKRGGSGRDAGGFIALPWLVLDCPAYARLSYPARALLLEIARQYVRDNNGRLLASAAYLSKRGWNSSDVITRAKRELLEARFIYETVKGHRPNKASWYAITWQTLDQHSGYDIGAAASFERGSYRVCEPLRIEALKPARGATSNSVAPANGAAGARSTPSHGAIKATNSTFSTPPRGDHLETPSVGRSIQATH